MLVPGPDCFLNDPGYFITSHFELTPTLYGIKNDIATTNLVLLLRQQDAIILRVGDAFYSCFAKNARTACDKNLECKQKAH